MVLAAADYIDSLEARVALDARWVQRLRQELWLGHGCSFAALYGDDGEMQCHTCRLDFKRAPVQDLVAFVEHRRLRLVVAPALTPLDGPTTNQPPVNT